MPDQPSPRRPVPPPFPFGPDKKGSAPRPVPMPEINQGEGDRIAARRYNEHVQDFVARGEVEPAARDAAEAVSGPEGDWLRKAEAEGKARAETSILDKVRGAIRRLFGGARGR